MVIQARRRRRRQGRKVGEVGVSVCVKGHGVQEGGNNVLDGMVDGIDKKKTGGVGRGGVFWSGPSWVLRPLSSPPSSSSCVVRLVGVLVVVVVVLAQARGVVATPKSSSPPPQAAHMSGRASLPFFLPSPHPPFFPLPLPAPARAPCAPIPSLVAYPRSTHSCLSLRNAT
jgi:hypothetical protein